MKIPDEFARIGANMAALGARRLALLGLVGMIVVGAVTLGSYYMSRPEFETLYSGLSVQDASRISAALREGGVGFDVSSDGARIMVARGQALRARMLLAERGLPSGTTAGYELFDKLGPLGLTTFMQEVTRARALEGELARSIQGMKGVLGARVHIVLPDHGSFRRSRQPASASVVLRTDPSATFSSAQAVRHLVAAAVPGMTVDRVRVVGTDGAVLAGGADAASAAPAHMVELERAVGKDVQDNVRRTLAPYLGIENFEISAVARLNIDKRQTNETSFDPDSKAERSVRVIKETSNSQNSNQRSTVSVEQNLPSEPTAAQSGDQSKRVQERKEELTNFELGSKTVQVVSEGYKIDSIAVAVVVNRKRLLAANQAAIEHQLKEIERVVGSAAGIDPRRGDKLTVSAVDFQEPLADAQASKGWLDAVTIDAGAMVKALSLIAAAFVLAWFGLRPTASLLLAPRPGEQRGALGAPEPALAMRDPGALPATDGGDLTADLTHNLAATPQKRLEQLIDHDEERAAMVFKHWIHGMRTE